MVRNFLLSITFVSLLMGFMGVQAGTYTYPEKSPVLTITFPDTWKVSLESGTSLIAMSPDDAIELNLWVLDKEYGGTVEEKLKSAVVEVDEMIKQWVTGAKFGEPTVTKHNGIDFLSIMGTGTYTETGKPINVSLDIFSPDEKQIFFLMYWGDEGAEVKHKADLEAIAASVKKP